MTKEEFKALRPSEQDRFIEEGGTIESTPSIGITLGKSENAATTSLQESPHSSPLVSSGDKVHSGLFDPNSDSRTSLSSPISNSYIGHEFADEHFKGFDIENPLVLLFMVSEDIRLGRVKLYPWQMQFLVDYAKGGSDDKHPFQSVVRACNGSGKDRFIIAPCVVWLCMRWKKSLGVVTSASGDQLDNQTCRYIKAMCENVNRVFGFEFWNTKYREYTLDFRDGSVSNIYAYATDEPKKAEGYHPSEFGAKMGIFVSEDKTVPDDINVAINKCTGYTHRTHVSTPGLPMGHFYDYCAIGIDRNSVKQVTDVKPTDWVQYHITAYDCAAHISNDYIEQMKRDLPGGEHGAAFKSQVLAEFGTTDEMVVIPYSYVWKAVNKGIENWKRGSCNKAGLDLSDGGAESVLVVRNGNRVIKIIAFKFDNTTDTVEYLNEQFKENNLTDPESFIFGDSVGIGKPMLDSLKKMGWNNIRYIDSRASARQPKTYRNRATELFFNMAKLLRYEELVLIRDELLMRQLSTRYYKIVASGVHQLLSKLEQRSRGYPSPDRADALNLAFWDYESVHKEEAVSDIEKMPVKPIEIATKSIPIYDSRSASKGHQYHDKYKSNGGQKDFSLLQEEIREINSKILTAKN